MWEHACGMVREIGEVKAARSEIHKQHHLRAALYFGVGAVEAFLNQEMRALLESRGLSDNEVFDALRHPGWKDKLKKWPKMLSGVDLPVPEGVTRAVKKLSGLRDEITHPKLKGHCIYLELDRLIVTPDQVRLIVSEFVVRTLAAMAKPYPFFLHGWVFIGTNGNDHWPIVETHNQQFIIALAHLGLSVPAYDVERMEAWERACMSSWDGFQQGERALAAARCQRREPEFPNMPRLCRQWWDKTHVETCGIN